MDVYEIDVKVSSLIAGLISYLNQPELKQFIKKYESEIDKPYDQRLICWSENRSNEYMEYTELEQDLEILCLLDPEKIIKKNLSIQKWFRIFKHMKENNIATIQ